MKKFMFLIIFGVQMCQAMELNVRPAQNMTPQDLQAAILRAEELAAQEKANLKAQLSVACDEQVDGRNAMVEDAKREKAAHIAILARLDAAEKRALEEKEQTAREMAALKASVENKEDRSINTLEVLGIGTLAVAGVGGALAGGLWLAPKFVLSIPILKTILAAAALKIAQEKGWKIITGEEETTEVTSLSARQKYLQKVDQEELSTFA